MDRKGLDMCLSTGTTDYWFVEGTSMAALKISAIAGLILCEDDSLKPNQVAKKIYKACEKLNSNKSKNPMLSKASAIR